jgi:hypothetical protein
MVGALYRDPGRGRGYSCDDVLLIEKCAWTLMLSPKDERLPPRRPVGFFPAPRVYCFPARSGRASMLPS